MICFVFLHYQNLDVTHQCSNYLKKLNCALDKHIIIVDNGSPNGSGEKLQDEYALESVITVMLSKENLGFAKGNNLGYDYAKKTMGAECIVVMNSDVYIKDVTFIEKLHNIINRNTNISVAAPDIVNIEGIHCNPMIIPPISKKSIIKIYRDNFLRYVMYSIPLINKKLWMRSCQLENPKKENRMGWESDREDIVPDGSCVIFFPHWIRNEDFAFVPVTFMYAEEHILYEYLKFKGYESAYFHNLQVYHMEGATTGSLTKVNISDGIKNKKRNLKWHMDACKKYLDYKKELCKNTKLK